MPRSRYVSFALPCGALYASFTGFCALGALFPRLFAYKASTGLFEATARPVLIPWPCNGVFLPFLEFCVRWARGGGRKGKGNTFLPPLPYGLWNTSIY